MLLMTCKPYAVPLLPLIKFLKSGLQLLSQTNAITLQYCMIPVTVA